MCEVNWTLLLEYLKIFLGWPPIALAIALVFFSRFRSAIQGLLNRVVEGNVLGQTFKAAPPLEQRAVADASADRLTQAVEAQHGNGPNVAAAANVFVPPELQNDPQAQAAITWVQANPGQTVAEYKRLLFSYQSERLFNAIYGTQISLLENLASRPTESRSLAELATFHEAHQTIVGRTDYQLRDYVTFLVNFGVVSVEGSPDNQQYRISQHGLEFLSYIKASYPVAWSQRAF